MELTMKTNVSAYAVGIIWWNYWFSSIECCCWRLSHKRIICVHVRVCACVCRKIYAVFAALGWSYTRIVCQSTNQPQVICERDMWKRQQKIYWLMHKHFLYWFFTFLSTSSIKTSPPSNPLSLLICLFCSLLMDRSQLQNANGSLNRHLH